MKYLMEVSGGRTDPTLKKGWGGNGREAEIIYSKLRLNSRFLDQGGPKRKIKYD